MTFCKVDTGFGKLANTHIPADQLELLQRNLVLSHSVGVGPLLGDDVVRLAMLLKIAALLVGVGGGALLLARNRRRRKLLG